MAVCLLSGVAVRFPSATGWNTAPPIVPPGLGLNPFIVAEQNPWRDPGIARPQ
jgi:hypothetical protein